MSDKKQIPGLPVATEAKDNDRLIKRDMDSGSDEGLPVSVLLERSGEQVGAHAAEEGDVHGIPANERAIHSEELRAAVSTATSTTEAVSMAGKGAIVESGSTPDGSYVRWENGEQVCFCSLSNGLTASATGTLGSDLYRSRTADNEDADWSFPASFSSAPTPQVGRVDRNPGWASALSSTNNGAAFLLFADSSVSDIGISASAWGFWK